MAILSTFNKLQCNICHKDEALPGVLGNRGKRVFILGEQRPNFEGNRGTKTILGNREQKKTNFRFLGNRGTSEFISGEQGNMYPPGKASKISILSILEWPFNTGFTVHHSTVQPNTSLCTHV